MTDTMLQILVSVFGGTSILELIGFIIYYRQNKRAKELDNTGKDIDNAGKKTDNFDKLLDSTNKVIDILEDKFNDSEDDSKQKKNEIERLTAEKEALVNEKIRLMEENGTLKIRCQRAEFYKCTCIDCTKRIPPLYSETKMSDTED